MSVEMLRHLEHGRLGSTAKYGLQLGVGHDFALVLRVLAAVVLDVAPELTGRLGAGVRAWPDHRGQFG